MRWPWQKKQGLTEKQLEYVAEYVRVYSVYKDDTLFKLFPSLMFGNLAEFSMKMPRKHWQEAEDYAHKVIRLAGEQ